MKISGFVLFSNFPFLHLLRKKKKKKKKKKTLHSQTLSLNVSVFLLKNTSFGIIKLIPWCGFKLYNIHAHLMASSYKIGDNLVLSNVFAQLSNF